MKSQVLQGEEARQFVAPAGWECLPPGDAGLTRKVKAAGPTVTLQEKRGRKVFSKGVWADARQIERARQEIEALRSSPTYQKKMQSDQNRRARKQDDYVQEFQQAVCQFLGFADRYHTWEAELARRVTAHATPVGSGTVARTQRIPVEKRAASAVIAWLRHQTTAYDDMKIARIKGQRRAVRAELARQSRQLLDRYRQGRDIPENCPLRAALESDH